LYNFSLYASCRSYTFLRLKVLNTSSITLELLRIAIYLSVSVGPVNALSPFAGEKFFMREETPVIALKKSVFSAGSTEVVDLYHLGASKA